MGACLVALLLGCGGGPAAPDDVTTPFDFSFTDPAGDTLPLPSGTTPGPAAVDLVAVTGESGGERLRIVLEFGAAIAPWSAAAANSLDGFVDLDLDEQAASGIRGAAEEAGRQPLIGVEYYVDLRDAAPHRVALVRTNTRTYTMVPVRFESDRATIEIPRDALGADDGQFLLSIVVGSRGRPITDIAPDTRNYAVHRPAPAP
jgi:hypothetical protein